MSLTSTACGPKSFLRFRVGFCCVVLSGSFLADRATAQISHRVGSPELQIKSVAVAQPATAAITVQLMGSGSTRVASRRVLLAEPQLQPPTNPALEQSPSDSPAKLVADPASHGDEKVTGDMDSKLIEEILSREIQFAVPSVNISTEGELPDDIAAGRAPPKIGMPDGVMRGMPFNQVAWQPADICHFPPYFEDAMLEHHGQVRWGCAQPLVSGVKFFSTLPLLPYLTTMHPPCEPRYSLGHFRPGTPAPVLKDHLPWDRRAATVEVLSAAGFWVAAPL